jgi:hypothetical protein
MNKNTELISARQEDGLKNIYIAINKLMQRALNTEGEFVVMNRNFRRATAA